MVATSPLDLDGQVAIVTGGDTGSASRSSTRPSTGSTTTWR
jgi:hypothetical protein